MKKHTLLSDIAVFLLIIFLFIVPPFFTRAVSVSGFLFKGWAFPWYQFLLAFLAAALLFFYYQKNEGAVSVWSRLNVFPVLFTFGMLFSVSLFCHFLAGVSGISADTINVVKPEGILQWSFCLLYFLSAAFYEEVLYRFYFTDQLFILITKKKIWRGSLILCEALGLLVFAFAHLYMGWISVLNAALAHVVLRLCYKNSCRLWPCVAAHFIYNVISLILL